MQARRMGAEGGRPKRGWGGEGGRQALALYRSRVMRLPSGTVPPLYLPAGGQAGAGMPCGTLFMLGDNASKSRPLLRQSQPVAGPEDH